LDLIAGKASAFMMTQWHWATLIGLPILMAVIGFVDIPDGGEAFEAAQGRHMAKKGLLILIAKLLQSPYGIGIAIIAWVIVFTSMRSRLNSLPQHLQLVRAEEGERLKEEG
jgi:hypothetical protein